MQDAAVDACRRMRGLQQFAAVGARRLRLAPDRRNYAFVHVDDVRQETMASGSAKKTPGPKVMAVVTLMAVQALCAGFFLIDLFNDIVESGAAGSADTHLLLELVANFGLVAGIAFEVHYLRQMFRRQAETDRALSVASGALADVIDAYFAEWGLTPAESDIASFTIKGFSILEVARMRGSAEGTIKTHLNSIYRKAGVAGRSQLVSLLIEDLLNDRLTAVQERSERQASAQGMAAAS